MGTPDRDVSSKMDHLLEGVLTPLTCKNYMQPASKEAQGEIIMKALPGMIERRYVNLRLYFCTDYWNRIQVWCIFSDFFDKANFSIGAVQTTSLFAARSFGSIMQRHAPLVVCIPCTYIWKFIKIRIYCDTFGDRSHLSVTPYETTIFPQIRLWQHPVEMVP